jgi:MOSC domain-containing protein YiiM
VNFWETRQTAYSERGETQARRAGSGSSLYSAIDLRKVQKILNFRFSAKPHGTKRRIKGKGLMLFRPVIPPHFTMVSTVRCIAAIHIAPATGMPMQAINHVRALVGKGLEGDRYAEGRGIFSPPPGTREVTLIEAEALEAFTSDFGQPLTAAQTRRNLLTRGVRLNTLVSREFRVGPVRLRGMSLCEPCALLARATGLPVLRGLLHRGGLCAKILDGGTISVGDPIEF